MKFNKTILPNGLRLVTIPMPDNPSVTVLVMAEAGSEYETSELSGISHFLEHMVFKGTPKRPKASDISRELDSIGAHYNAFTSHQFTGYYAKADTRHLDAVLDIVSDMYIHPAFDAKEMEKEKGVIVEEIRMYRDIPQRRVHDVLSELLYGDQPAGRNLAGTEANVRSFSRESLFGYYSSHYVARATTILVAGSFDEKTIGSKVQEAFSGIGSGSKPSKPAVVESQKEPAVKTEAKETDQTHMVFGFRAFPISDPRAPALQVMATALGGGMSSRLFQRMRDDLGICYYVSVGSDLFTDHGFVAISAGVDNSRVDIAIKEILNQCAKLKDEPVSEAELRKVKDYISGTTMLELETSEARAEFAGYQEALKGRIEAPSELMKRVEAVTADDVRRLAREIFVPSGLNLALVGRSKAEDVRGLLVL